MKIAHVILTRFNMPTEGREAKLRNDPQWLSRRFELFEQFCLPSVTGQVSKDFSWLIYFDSCTPAPYRERIDALAGIVGVRPILRPNVVPLEEIIGHVKESCLPGTTHVITSALDNDDALACDFVSRLREAGARHERAALNFPVGFVYANGKTYLRRDTSSPFISMIEPIQSMRTAWSAWHTDLGQHAPLVQLSEQPGWLQVVHERNVTNRIRGRRVTAVGALKHFAIDVPTTEERPSAIRLENLTLTPIREIREGLWRGVKPLVRRIRGW